MSLFDEAETECKKEEIKEEVTEETITVPEHTRKKKRGRDMELCINNQYKSSCK